MITLSGNAAQDKQTLAREITKYNSLLENSAWQEEEAFLRAEAATFRAKLLTAETADLTMKFSILYFTYTELADRPKNILLGLLATKANLDKQP